MKIIVAIKQVPERDCARAHRSSSGKWIEEADLSFEINEPDAYALEEALQLKEKHGGEVVVALRRPGARLAATIREALAKGADRAIHIECDDLASARSSRRRPAASPPPSSTRSPTSSSPACSPTISATARPASSWPNCSACRTPPSSCRSRRPTAGISVKRELEDGWFQNIEMPLPALLTIQSGSNKLRYATLMGIKKAKTKEVRRVSAADLGARPPRLPSRSSASTCRRSKKPRRSSPARPRKPPRNWSKN